MGFGFVIVKFALFTRQISSVLDRKLEPQGKGYSAIIGVIMVGLGALMIALAYIRYRNVERQLNSNSYFPSRWLTVVVTFSLIIGAVLLVLYLLPNI